MTITAGSNRLIAQNAIGVWYPTSSSLPIFYYTMSGVGIQIIRGANDTIQNNYARIPFSILISTNSTIIGNMLWYNGKIVAGNRFINPLFPSTRKNTNIFSMKKDHSTGVSIVSNKVQQATDCIVVSGSGLVYRNELFGTFSGIVLSGMSRRFFFLSSLFKIIQNRSNSTISTFGEFDDCWFL